MRILMLLTVALALQQPQAADPEIYLIPIQVKGGVAVAGDAVNITNNDGYDNQPMFTPDGALLFASARGAAPAGGGGLPPNDIYRYDLRSKQTARLTETPEPEFSPTVTPDGKHISCIRVEADGTQRLWQFTIDGKNPALVFTDIKPVGYHAWLDDHHVVMFILGAQGQPATLQVGDTRTGKAEVVATGIGRSVQRIPGGGVAFTARNESGSGSRFMRVTLEGGTPKTTVITDSPAGVTDPYAIWLRDGTLITTAGGTLQTWRPQSGWNAVAKFDSLGLHNPSRLAINSAEDVLAIVADRK